MTNNVILQCADVLKDPITNSIPNTHVLSKLSCAIVFSLVNKCASLFAIARLAGPHGEGDPLDCLFSSPLSILFFSPD